MKSELCTVSDTDEGVSVEFDSTECAGDAIAEKVYGTGMGYSDEGVVYLFPVFEKIVEKLPGVCFESDTECSNKWVETSYHFGYNGEVLTVEGIDVKKYNLVNKNMSLYPDPDEIAEKTGLSADEVVEIIDMFFC